MTPITRNHPQPSRTEDLNTSHGPARAHYFTVPHGVPRASLILGHGAGRGIDSPDLSTLAAELPGHGIEVILAEQPWKVAGRPVAAAKSVLDESWLQIVAGLRRAGAGLRRLALGGRSAGARVACRTAEATKPDALVCLAFPLLPRKSGADRSDELAAGAAQAPTVVIQGTADEFGGPPEIAERVAAHGQRVLAVGIPFVDHSFHLTSGATLTDVEARLVLVECARRAVLRTSGNSGPLLAR